MSTPYNKEYSPPPEEFRTQKEQDLTPVDAFEEFGPHSPEFTEPTEYVSPAPEITEPGKYPWQKPKRREQKAVFKLALGLAAAAFVVTQLFGVFSDPVSADNAEAVTENLRQESYYGEETESSGRADDESSVSQESEPSDGSSSDMTTEESTGSSEQNSESSIQDSESSEESSHVISEEPECEILLISFYSEMQGVIYFDHMADVIKVELQIYDTLTGSLEETRDITSSAKEGEYVIAEFTTDEIYERHQEAYAAVMSFPMEVRMDVIMTYNTDHGEETKVVSAVSADERAHMWYVKYVPESDEWENAGKILIEIMDIGEDDAVVTYDPDYADDDMKVGTYRITAEYNGEFYDLTANGRLSTYNTTSYDSDGNENPMVITDIAIEKPAGVKEDDGQVIHFTISWYVEAFGKVVTLHKDVLITSDYL